MNEGKKSGVASKSKGMKGAKKNEKKGKNSGDADHDESN
jgi:hypothetical protein